MKIRQIPRSWLYTAIRIFSLCALFFASMLAVDYYFVAHTFCEEGASCAVVAQSEFGQKYGIFLPTLGLVAYSFFFLTSFAFSRMRRKIFGKSISAFWNPLAIICCALGALLFIIVQAMEIHAFCWLCMGIDTSAILMVVPAVLLMLQQKAENAEAAKENAEAAKENAEEAKEDGEKGEPAEAPVVAPSWLHPVLWISFYLLIAAGPIAWGTRTVFDSAKALPAEGGTVVPEYIHSFYKPGKINVVEISSFDCPHCRRLHPTLSPLLEEYGSRINFTRLTIPLGKQKEACVAYYCAEKQKKENPFADCMFEKPSKEASQLLEYARQCSIDEESFKACLVAPESSKAVDDMLDNIRKTGFQGAPTIWIDDVEIVGYDERLGAKPYRDAIEKNPAASDNGISATKIAFNIALLCVTAGAFCFVGGGVMTVLRRRKKEA